MRKAKAAKETLVSHLNAVEAGVLAQDSLGQRELDQWKEREREWLVRVLDSKQRDVLDDPYHVAEEDRTHSVHRGVIFALIYGLSGPSLEDLDKVLQNASVPSSIAGGMNSVVETGIELQEAR